MSSMNNFDEYLWSQKYRPKKIKDCILPDDLKKAFMKFVRKKEINNLLFFGTSGVGKTTVAKALCDEVGADWIIVNGSEERGIDMLRSKVKKFASSVSMFSEGRKVIIIDEADFLTPEAQAAFRGMIEEFSNNCSFIFTCNKKALLIDAIHSRCSSYDFKIKKEDRPKMAELFYDKIVHILNDNQIDYKESAVVELMRRHFPDYRRTINELQKYAVNGSVDEGVLGAQYTSLRELFGFLKDKDFTGMRKWVATNTDSDSTIFRALYDEGKELVEPRSLPALVLIVNDSQYKASFVVDAEINLVACLTELMSQCEFK
jgi:DNA polymerase III delta prime subunit